MAEEIITNVTVAEQPKVLEVPSTMKSLVEALIFAAREPLSTKQIQTLYTEQSGSNGEARKIDASEIAQIVEELNADFAAADKPYRIVQIAGGYQFATLSAYAEWLGKLYKEQSRRKLSQSSIESLSIIAYKQPISKPEIEAIRGVNCDYVLKTLLEKELVTIVGRAPTPGRPLLYGTTKEFLKHFGLNEVSDLPRPREIEEILGESQFEAERRMLEAQQGLDQEKKPEEDFKSRLPHIPKRKPELDESVKIVPKKRSRELKVRTEDETQQKLELEKPQTVVPEGEVATPPPIETEPTVQAEASVADGVASGTDEIVDKSVMETATEPELSQDQTPPSAEVPHVIFPLHTSEGESETVEAAEISEEPGEEKGEIVGLGAEGKVESVQVEEPISDVSMKTDTLSEDAEEIGSTVAVHAESEVQLEATPEVESESTVPEIVEPVNIEGAPVATVDEREELPVTEEQPNEDASVLVDEAKEQEPVLPQAIEQANDLVELPVPQHDIVSPEVVDKHTGEIDIPSPEVSPAVEESSQRVTKYPQITDEQPSEEELVAPHPKSKWQSWKEKIQGFIKKLFG